MRLAVLHTRLSPYYAACFRALKEQGAELMLHIYPTDQTAPFTPQEFAFLDEVFNRFDSTSREIYQRIERFQPDAVLVSGWLDRSYLKICRNLRKLGIPVIAGCDTQWNGSLRQRIAGFASPIFLKSAIDVLWIPGEPQRRLADQLGYRDKNCWDGLYSCDWELFARDEPDHEHLASNAPQFLFVGRYSEEKGIRTLLDAYEEYLTRAESPWQLACAGTGPLESLLNNSKATNLGFVQPSNLPRLMRSATCFVLPSAFEPWGVVLHEAAASGLPLICSEACGAGHHLLQHGKNGYLVPAGDSRKLADAMHLVEMKSAAERTQMAKTSYTLSRQYTPGKWVGTLKKGIQALQ